MFSKRYKRLKKKDEHAGIAEIICVSRVKASTIRGMTQFNTLPLDPAVLQALEQMGYHSMTPIQEMAIPKLLTGQDFVGQAPTGTGKTAAFGIPLISRMSPGSGKVDALILAPTRELAQQIAEELNRIGSVKGVKVLPVFGGESVFTQKDLLRQREHTIVVGTPGRVLDHIRQVTLDLSATRLVVLDEADEMLDMGFRPDIEAILSNLPGGRETWLFSATLSPEIRKIADQYMYYPEEVRIQPQVRTAEAIAQHYFIVKEEEKPRLLKKLLRQTEDFYGLVFCRTKKDVVQLTRKLRDSFPMDCLHGAMTQGDRDKVMDEFRQRKLKLLVATDIMARGIDVDNLTHVINYSPPDEAESYIHRIGRTARKGESGVAWTFFDPSEQWALERLERKVKMKMERHPDSEGEFVAPTPGERGGKPGRRFGGGGQAPRGPGGPSGGQRNRSRNRRSGPRAGGSAPAQSGGSV